MRDFKLGSNCFEAGGSVVPLGNPSAVVLVAGLATSRGLSGCGGLAVVTADAPKVGASFPMRVHNAIPCFVCPGQKNIMDS